MAISLVQTVTANVVATTVVATVTGVTAGNLLTIEFGYYIGGNTTQPSTPTDTNGTVSVAEAPAGLTPFGTDVTGANIFYVQNANAGIHVITSTVGLGNSGRMTVTEWSGAATSSVLDQHTNASTSGGANTSQSTGTTGTTSQANELVIIALDTSGSPGSSNIGIPSPAVSGFTDLQKGQNTSSDIGFAHAYKIISSTGTQSATFTWTDNTTNASQAVIATFKAAAGGGTTLTLSNGSYSLSGQAENSFLLTPLANGTYSLSGQALSFGAAVQLAFGSYSLAGQAIALGATQNDFILLCNSGTYSYIGALSNSDLQTDLIQGSYSLSGQSVSLSIGQNSFTLPIGFGVYSLGGQSILLIPPSVPGGGSMMMLFGKRKR